jgi:hypothetical protein
MVVGVAVGTTMLGGYLVRGAATTKKPHAAAPSSSAELNELTGRVAGLEQAMAANEHRYSAVEQSVGGLRIEAPGVPDRPQHDLAPPAPPLSPEEQRDLDARRRERFERLLGSEARDRSWASDYETSLRDAVQATATAHGASAPAIDSVTCRTSICRLVLTSSSLETQSRFMGDFHDHLPPMAAVHFSSVVGDDNSSKLTLDFVRAGYPTGAIDGPVD